MRQQTDWMKILIDCKNAVRERIAPLLKTLNEPQPNLGIGADGDAIKQVDLAAESAIIDTFRRDAISFTLVSEESGVREYGMSPHECFVTTDPIDGTTNLVRGIPFYATSIAISKRPVLDTVHAALVADLSHDLTYVAQKGKGACHEKEKIIPSNRVSLEDAVIGVDMNSYKVERIVPQLTSLIQRTKHIRHFGANALEICYVADGTTDAFIDVRGKLRATDVAAAWLILNEAGALMTKPDGKSLNVALDPKQKVDFVASGNQKLHRTILGLMKPEKEAR